MPACPGKLLAGMLLACCRQARHARAGRHAPACPGKKFGKKLSFFEKSKHLEIKLPKRHARHAPAPRERSKI
jgi:hypothetical protein